MLTFNRVSSTLMPVRFEGRKRQEYYLNQLQQLTPEVKQVFMDIFDSATKTANPTDHVIKAAIGSMKHPELYSMTRENVMIRSALAMAKASQDTDTIDKLEEALEDFHIATDAYVKTTSLEAAAKAREQQAPHHVSSEDSAQPVFDKPEDYKLFLDFINPLRDIINKRRKRK